jgi:thioredoxin reductase (NADPH)
MEEILDLIIMGGGPAGLTAGLYAARSRLNCLLLERQGPGGQVLTTHWIENYPGFPEGISGWELVQKMVQQVEAFGLQIEIREAVGLSRAGPAWRIETSDGYLYGHSIIVASGADYAKLGVPGEEHLRGKGVSYCATCDGPFFQGLPVAVVGGGDTALQEALYLTRFASGITLIHRRDRLRGAKVLQERIEVNHKIRVLWNSEVMEILGGERLEGVQVRDRISGKSRELAVSGVFICVGSRPNTAFLKGVLSLDDSGFIITDEELRASASGVFAAGDCRRKSLRQVATAVGEGALAAHSALNYLEGLSSPHSGNRPRGKIP